jgi:hypothetical protein
MSDAAEDGDSMTDSTSSDPIGPLRAPFPAFGGKRDVVDDVWARLGTPKQYTEPFCFSAAMLLGSPVKASLEVIGDMNGFVANFWRAVSMQPEEVARWSDYPVSHIDLGARHIWLMQQRDRIGAELQDPNWPGDAKVAGWWLWGQCAWIGSGFCEWTGKVPGGGRSKANAGVEALGQIPSMDPGRGVQASGKIPHVSDAGRGVQAAGQIPHVGNAGMGVQAFGKIPFLSCPGQGVQSGLKADAAAASVEFLTSSGRVAGAWLKRLADRLERVRVIHGDWSRCLNHHYGGAKAAFFFDPPYDHYEGLYHVGPVAQAVAAWCREHEDRRIALCGHRGDYDMPGWEVFEWSRSRNTYGGTKTKDAEAIWFSPACLKVAGSTTCGAARVGALDQKLETLADVKLNKALQSASAQQQLDIFPSATSAKCER